MSLMSVVLVGLVGGGLWIGCFRITPSVGYASMWEEGLSLTGRRLEVKHEFLGVIQS